MRSFDLLPSLLRRLPALLLVGMFALMATGLVHGTCTDGDGEPEQTEHVVFCECACHHHVYVSDPDPTQVDFDLSESKGLPEYQNLLSDADPSGVFRPPEHLV